MNQTQFSFFDFNEAKKITAIIIFVLAFFAFLWEIMSGFRTSEPITTVNNSANVASNQMPLRANSALFTTALWGHYIPVNLSNADIKQSMLDVEVVGIIFSEKEKNSKVVIRVGGGEEKYYSIGDTLPGGAVIKRILAESVVVLYNGVLESLSLPKNELIFDASTKPLIEE